MARVPVLAAGGIVLRREKTPLIAVVRLRKRDEWVLPKGKLDDGETPRDAAERADDGIARTDHDRRIGIGRTQAGLELARKTIMQALEVGLARLGKIEIGKQPPAGDREIADQGLLDLAEPAHEPGQGRPRDTIGQQEVQVFLLGQSGDQASNCHESVSGID